MRIRFHQSKDGDRVWAEYFTVSELALGEYPEYATLKMHVGRDFNRLCADKGYAIASSLNFETQESLLERKVYIRVFADIEKINAT